MQGVLLKKHLQNLKTMIISTQYNGQNRNRAVNILKVTFEV